MIFEKEKEMKQLQEGLKAGEAFEEGGRFFVVDENAKKVISNFIGSLVDTSVYTIDYITD